MKTGCRYVRAVRQSINKILQSKSSVHQHLAVLITGYSHKSRVHPGSYLMDDRYVFFVVKKMLSPHWCMGFFCPPRTNVYMTINGSGIRYYTPDMGRRSRIRKKRIFSPFRTVPEIRMRRNHFHLESKLLDEQVPNIPIIFG